MRKINLKSPKYIIPLISLPFILILFYVYHQSIGKVQPIARAGNQLNPEIARVSADVDGKGLVDKLQAYRDRFKQSNGYTAIASVQAEVQGSENGTSGYNQKEMRMLDSIEAAIKSRNSTGGGTLGSQRAAHQFNSPPNRASTAGSILAQDRALASALNAIENRQSPRQSQRPSAVEVDPMSLFRAQMSLVDSIGKANDPDYQAKLKSEQRSKALAAKPAPVNLPVSMRASQGRLGNTIFAKDIQESYIPAIIDQELTALSGSRIRIRLLSEIMVGSFPAKKGTLLYGTISGFSSQRVFISIATVLYHGQLLPVKLEVYDLDGLKGIYVPASAFREFTKDLGSSGTQGISIESTGEENKQLMSIMGRMFQSTSSALNHLMRSNKAKIKYATHLLLVDTDQLQKQQAKP